MFQRPHKYFDYGIQGGSFDLRTYTLDQFYKKHLLGWNIWTRSNEGYDLARYFGTTWWFWPHPHQPYMVFWERNWETTEFEQLPKMHPAWLLTHRRNVKIVFPRSWHGRRKKITIRPPSLQTSTWWYAASWVGIALFRIGVSPINLENPFVHKTNGTTQPFYAVPIGWGAAPVANQLKPLPMDWHYDTFKKITQSVKINYRWWWDTGEENYILANTGHLDATNNPKVRLDVIPVYYPYYIFFYGAMLPQGKDNVTQGTDAPYANPVLLGKKNPSPLAIWWYYDRVAYYGPDRITPQMDTRYLRPEDLPTQGRTWVYFTGDTKVGTSAMFNDDNAMMAEWTTSIIGPTIQAIVEHSPFVMGRFDIPFRNQEFNVTATYKSHWQWGGIVPRPDTVLNPEDLHSNRPPQISVRDPATVGVATIHPWDLTQGGTVNEHKLRAILTDILTPPGGAPSAVGRPHSPDRSPPRKRRRKADRRTRHRPPETSSESDESDEPPNSSSSGTPSESGETPETSENEEEPPAAPSTKRPRILLRKPFLLR